MPSSLVFVKDALISHAVDNWHGFVVCGLGGGLVATIDRCKHLLDVSTYHGAQAGVMIATDFGLASAFFGLG